MMTFSIYTNTYQEATTYNIIGGSSVDLDSVLTALHDNTDKEITPVVLRNSVLTALSTTAFKETFASQSSIEYVGIDNANTEKPKGTAKLGIIVTKLGKYSR